MVAFNKLINFLFDRHCKECDRLQTEVIGLRQIIADQEERSDETKDSLRRVDLLYIEADEIIDMLLNKIRQHQIDFDYAYKVEKDPAKRLELVSAYSYRLWQVLWRKEAWKNEGVKLWDLGDEDEL